MNNDPVKAAAMALLRVMESNILTAEQFRLMGHVKRLAGVATNRELKK